MLLTIRHGVRLYLVLAGAGLAVLLGLIGYSNISFDRARFASQIEERLHEVETEAVRSLRRGDWITQLRAVQKSNRILSNDLVNELERLSQAPFTIYLYNKDTLIYWSKPGLAVDPTHKEFQNLPVVIRDHRQDYLIKKADIADGRDLLQAYFKIPILPDEDHAYSVAITPFQFGHFAPDQSTLIRGVDKLPIAHVELLTREYSALMQAVLLFLCLLILGSLSIAWVLWIGNWPEPRLTHVNKTLVQIFGLLALRMLTLLFPYHDFFDQLSLLSPIIQDITFPYSTLDLLLDCTFFLSVCTLASRLYSREMEQTQTAQVVSSIKQKTVDRLMSLGHYLIVILMSGLAAWILRQFVGQSNFHLDGGEVSMLDLRHFLSILACGLILMGVFTFSFQIVTRAIHYTTNFYERMLTLLLAGVLSLPLIYLIDIDLPYTGFYLGVFMLLTMLDLYVEQGHKTVIWVMSWLIAISSMTALVLYKYQRDFEKVARTELIELAPLNTASKSKLEESFVEWLPDLPRQYSLAVYEQGQLVFAHQHDYAIVMPELNRLEAGRFFSLPTSEDRVDIGLRNDAGRVLLIGKKAESINQILSLFSLIFTLFSFLLFILAWLNAKFGFLPQNMELTISPRPSLRNKIQIAVVLIILLTFFLVGLLTVYYVRSTSRADELRRYDERLRTIAGSVRQTPTQDSTTWRQDMRQASRVALAQNVPNLVYDPNGDIVQSQEENLRTDPGLPVKMAFLPKLILDAGSRDYYLVSSMNHAGQVAPDRDVGFIAIHQSDGTSGYLELPELFPTGIATGDPGSAFIMILLNAYVFIFLLAIGMAVFMSRSIARPLAQLSEKLKKIRLGKKNETISWNIDDEVGELIQDYNVMVTKLDESAALLAQTERDTAWREMAKQVAHEIKNPLTPMKLSIQYLQNAASRGDQLEIQTLINRVSRTLIEQIDNLTHIASEFSSYAKMPQAMNEVFVINDVVASVHDLFRKREDMDIQLQVPINDLYVFADKSQMVRVLNNIVKNAIQAIPKTRRGLIEMKLTFSDEMIVISITDNGVGIEDHMRDKVFYPNFTTKSSGMGLGLAICSDIIQSFDGKIYFETEKGVGTTFFIELPRHAQNKQHETDIAPQPEPKPLAKQG